MEQASLDGIGGPACELPAGCGQRDLYRPPIGPSLDPPDQAALFHAIEEDGETARSQGKPPGKLAHSKPTVFGNCLQNPELRTAEPIGLLELLRVKGQCLDDTAQPNGDLEGLRG